MVGWVCERGFFGFDFETVCSWVIVLEFCLGVNRV